MDTFLDEVVGLRDEHEALARKKKEAHDLFLERSAHPRKRDIAKALGVYFLSMGTLRGPKVQAMILGPGVLNNVIDADDAYAQNIKAATMHKEEHFPEYLQMAREDMELHPQEDASSLQTK
jgi:hypothetical protein